MNNILDFYKSKPMRFNDRTYFLNSKFIITFFYEYKYLYSKFIKTFL